jgi:hypothetical protein
LSLFEETKPHSTGKSGGRVKAQNRLSAAQLRELEDQKEREVLMRWKRVRELWPRLVADGEEEVEMEWLLEAEKLAETFRETRLLFLSSRVCASSPSRRTDFEWRITVLCRVPHFVACYQRLRPGQGKLLQRKTMVPTKRGWRLVYTLISVSPLMPDILPFEADFGFVKNKTAWLEKLKLLMERPRR